jgi:hypothetical protein
MKTLVTTPKSCWKEKPHHLAVETYFFTWDFDHFWEFKKTGAPLPMLREHVGAPYTMLRGHHGALSSALRGHHCWLEEIMVNPTFF